ncbi:uncharacterized protein GIQ15_02120 [Arthroderma uncinatum]|uniref:uncharacterized protein n=1 Tax=Arthroderma uncinatum TaxID=74035 RepID=UPI00144A8FF3|nr:uncharacterized protein GIQ15_02120 [Arthroderma uncinatum]KAF3482796.1 hypothetical protein GIQ15_02120 [Arthroderma uncinatum]
MSGSTNPNQRADNGSGSDASRTSIAVIGSGMAGLVTAYLLQRDENHSRKFDIEVFESQETLSLDSASVTIESKDGGAAQHINQPMRDFDEGFYPNLKRMYDYLGIQCDPKKFLFSFSYMPKADPGDPSAQDHEEAAAQAKVSFVHSSNNHQLPPIRPEGLSLWSWIGEIIYLAFFFAWFIVACFWINPGKGHRKPSTMDQDYPESLEEYFRRIHLPTYFVDRYIIPSFSSMSTCSHREMLSFPANDIVQYIRRTYGAPHYLVRAGIREVERTLSKGLNIRLGARVTSVRQAGTSVMVCWESTSSASELAGEKIPPMSSCQRTFDHVILAIPPNAVGAIFEPLRAETSVIPTTSVEAFIHTDYSTIPCIRSSPSPSAEVGTASNAESQWIHLRSTPESTESIHQHPSSYIITNSPLTPIEPGKIVHRAYFTRTLRTPQSRDIVNRIFDKTSSISEEEKSGEHESRKKQPVQWRNGDGNVWLVGSWCWDGMVLLEGCIVSAMRVADEFGVMVPWAKS